VSSTTTGRLETADQREKAERRRKRDEKPLLVGMGLMPMMGSTFCARHGADADTQGKGRGAALCTSKQMVGVTGAFLGSGQSPLPLREVPGGTFNSEVYTNEGA
jgi:hypothetical protein